MGDGRRSYPIQMMRDNRFGKREAETDSAFTYSVMAHHPSDDGMEDNRYNVFRMDTNQMNGLNMNQRYRMNNMNQMDRPNQEQRMNNMMMNDPRMNNDQMDRRMNGQRMQSYRMNQRQLNQMNRPNNMFDMDAFNQNQQRTNSFNQIDGQRMQYRMDTNQRNPMTQLNQRNQMNQMKNQMTQMNQLNQFDNRRFKRDAESDFVSYRTMTETPTQRSHTEVHRYTEPQHIQLV